MTEPAFAPCPLCRQYSHSIGEDQLTAALHHFESMYSHRGDGIPTQHMFDEATRDAAQVLMAAAAPRPRPVMTDLIVTQEDREAKSMVAIAKRNLRYFIETASFKCEVDRTAALNCLDVIEEEISGLDDLVTVLRNFHAADAAIVETARIKAALAMQADWRPIETAPKDGTLIDVWRLAPDGIHGKRIPDIRWDNNRSFNGGIGRVAMPDAWTHSHGGEVYLAGGSLTHWMPLPAPPAIRNLEVPE